MRCTAPDAASFPANLPGHSTSFRGRGSPGEGQFTGEAVQVTGRRRGSPRTEPAGTGLDENGLITDLSNEYTRVPG
ncbi:hypothetical protein GCM10010121_084660 [Streptomyces brasiliensis]|uniref:Uncharacterized protein n=1 Tax=Streptomyces brasiliensis TaxID=1954 RepID=A0A917P4P9_9ACTN|nr:hypothetical protein GCM10010121_084660 [Streptomyces brasiliensis]